MWFQVFLVFVRHCFDAVCTAAEASVDVVYMLVSCEFRVKYYSEEFEMVFFRYSAIIENKVQFFHLGLSSL